MAAYIPESTSTSILLTAEESTCLSNVLRRSQPLQSFLEATLQQPLSSQTTSMLKDLLNALQMEPILPIGLLTKTTRRTTHCVTV